MGSAAERAVGLAALGDKEDALVTVGEMSTLGGVHSFQRNVAALYLRKSEIVPNGKLLERATSAESWFDRAALLARDQEDLFWHREPL